MSKLHTRDGTAIRDFLYAQLLQGAEKYGALVRMSNDRRKAKTIFCILLPTQLCFYADSSSTVQLKGGVDLTQVERIGDHATNIAEIIHFELTGEELVSQRPKLDAIAQ